MAKAGSWSPSSLDTFVSCGLQFYHKYVAKDLPPEPSSPEQAYGLRVHKAFEDRMGLDKPLPPDLASHEGFLARLEEAPGMIFTEQKVALTKELQACSWEWRKEEIWWRGVIDLKKVSHAAPTATLVDYKTGKPHSKFVQLAQYAIHTFTQHPEVEICDVKFYWTQTGTVTRKVWGRKEIPDLWAMITPDLKQMSLAYKSDTWQPRPSGLCKGWCPVKDCAHWEPKRPKR